MAINFGGMMSKIGGGMSKIGSKMPSPNMPSGGVQTGPSQGFWQKLLKASPQILQGAGQMFGDPQIPGMGGASLGGMMGGAANIMGGINRIRGKGAAQNTGMYGGGPPPQPGGGTGAYQAINTGPSTPGTGSGFISPGMYGGMGQGMEDPNAFWQMYSRFLQQQPNRGMMGVRPEMY